MPTNLLLLPLLAGYWFVHKCHFFKFKAQQLDGYRLLLESVLAGVVFFAVARMLTWATSFWPSFRGLRQVWYSIAPLPYAGTAVLSLLIGFVTPYVVNRFIGPAEAKRRALRGSTDDLAQLLHSAMERELPVSISMDTRKFYVGYVLKSPNLDPSEKNISILPMFSGYRDKDTLNFRFTTDYTQTYESLPNHLTEEDFQIVLPVESIKSANIFDPTVYKAAFSEPPEVDGTELTEEPS